MEHEFALRDGAGVVGPSGAPVHPPPTNNPRAAGAAFEVERRARGPDGSSRSGTFRPSGAVELTYGAVGPWVGRPIAASTT
jgi:hypothetical protein